MFQRELASSWTPWRRGLNWPRWHIIITLAECIWLLVFAFTGEVVVSLSTLTRCPQKTEHIGLRDMYMDPVHRRTYFLWFLTWSDLLTSRFSIAGEHIRYPRAWRRNSVEIFQSYAALALHLMLSWTWFTSVLWNQFFCSIIEAENWIHTSDTIDSRVCQVPLWCHFDEKNSTACCANLWWSVQCMWTGP